jgi:hypothetical protein
MSLTITASLEDISGTANVGWAVFTLVGFGDTPPTVSRALISQLQVTAVANSSGAISQTILGNDVISPSGTSYLVEIFSSTGAPVWCARCSLTGSGSHALSSFTPLGN